MKVWHVGPHELLSIARCLRHEMFCGMLIEDLGVIGHIFYLS